MTLQLLCFWYWSNIVVTSLNKDADKWDPHNQACQTFLTVTAVYLLFIEITGVYRAGLGYIRDFTRLFNLIVPTLNMINVYNTANRDQQYFWTI